MLVEDALFCHKCGRPVRPLVVEEPPAVAAPPEPEPPPEDIVILRQAQPEDLPVDFRNRLAVRCAMLAAAAAQLLTSLLSVLGGALLFPLVMIGGGWFASFLYRRRCGVRLTTQAGARIGWISGVFSFIITAIFFTLNIALLVSSKEAMEAYRKSAAAMGMPSQMLDEMNELLHNPAPLFVALLIVVLLLFIFHTLMSAIGGALEAVASRRREP
jgi:hypothetical protein